MRSRPLQRQATRGFTLLELMVTVGLAAVIAAVAIPNLRSFILNNRLTTTSNDLLRAFQQARSEAVKRQRFVVVCSSSEPAADSPTCSEGNFGGWIVFVDEDKSFEREDGEEVLTAQLAATGVTVINDQSGIISYGPSGFANSVAGEELTSVVVICDERGTASVGDSATSRLVLIAETGRVRSSKKYDEVVAAIDVLDDAGVCAVAE